jgi:predicted Ser/Thr protein kinase
MLGQGDRIAGYEVEGVIARGGMGVVYRARHAGLGRSVALKVIASELAEDPTFRARFVREARLAASLDHPNVIPIFEAGEDDGELFIAMRLVDGCDLERLIDRSGPLDVALACRIVGQAAAGLEAAHRRGLVHRDVKPANILLAGPAQDPHVYVSDFGVAKASAPGGGLTHSSEWVGTPGYAAPEQVRGGEVDARADVYALGCVLLAALTRRRVGDSQQPAELPAAVGAVIERATAASPAARFQSAGELADALSVAGSPAGEREAGRGERTTGPEGETTGPGGETDGPGEGTGGPGGGAGIAGGVANGGGTAVGATLPAATRPAPVRRVGVSGLGRPTRWGAAAGGGDRRRGWPAVAFVVGFTAIIGGVVAVALTRETGHRSATTVGRTPTPRVAGVSIPAAAGGGDTVFCGPAACRQAGRPVLVPIEGGSCVRDAAAGRWTRLDGGAAEPMLICLPATNLPRVVGAVSVPTVTGGRLDHVETALDRLGMPYRTSGGGLFGIVSAGNWTVCATRPAPGADLPASAEVTVFVEHSC